MKTISILATVLLLSIGCKKEKENFSSKLIWNQFLDVSVDINRNGINVYLIKDPEDTSKNVYTIDLRAGDEIKIYNADTSKIQIIELGEGKLEMEIDTTKINSFISGESKIYKIKIPFQFKVKEKINFDSLFIKYPKIKHFFK